MKKVHNAITFKPIRWISLRYSPEHGEFLTRVRVVLRRWSAYKTGPLTRSHLVLVGDLLINTDARQVMLHGKTVHLTPTEYDILHDLVTHQGKVVRHRELLKAVWGDVYGDEREYLRVFQFFGSFLIFGADKFAS